MRKIYWIAIGIGLIIGLSSVLVEAKTNNTLFTSDDYTGAIWTIDVPHAKTHLGEKYLAGYSAILADTATTKISFRTTSAIIHMTFIVECSGEGTVTGYENPTVTVSTGAQLAAFNTNRLSSNTTDLREATTGVYVAGNLALNATVSGGTAIFPTYHFGAGKKVGGSAGFGEEYIFKTLEDYALVVTSEAADNHCSVQLNWYEN